jgi:hypothetical protein
VTPHWVGPVASALLAAVISLIEIVGQEHVHVYRSVCGWVAFRLTVHGGSAAVAYGLLIIIFKGTDWDQWYFGIIPIMLAGLCAPAIVRAQLAVFGSGQESATDNPATRFRVILGWIDDKIIDGCLIAETGWVSRAFLEVQNLPTPNICDRSKMYITSTRRLKVSQKKESLKFLDDTMADSSTDADKCQAIVTHLLSIRARGLVVQMIKEASGKKTRKTRRLNSGH